MKNKKMVFGTILLLFALIGICNISNVSAQETIEIPPLSYTYKYTATLEPKDFLWLEIESNGIINVYIMNEEQFDELQDSGGLIWTYCKRWRDITYLHESFTITEDGSYYVILYNKALLTGRTVYVDIDVYYNYETAEPSDPSLGLLVVFIIVAIFGAAIALVVRNYKRKNLREDIKLEKVSKTQEKQIPKITYCRECGTEIADESKMFCPMCGKEQ